MIGIDQHQTVRYKLSMILHCSVWASNWYDAILTPFIKNNNMFYLQHMFGDESELTYIVDVIEPER